jgi:hypothetical protein
VDINLDMPEDYNPAPPSVDKGHKIVAPVVPRSIANPYLHNGPSSTDNLTVDVLVQIVKPLMKIDKLDLRIKRGAVLTENYLSARQGNRETGFGQAERGQNSAPGSFDSK